MALLLLAFPSAVAAQEMVFDPGPTEACLAAAPADLSSCIGHAADACMMENDQGETTLGMAFCLMQEWEWWDARLSAAHGALAGRHEAEDARMREIGVTVPSVALALGEMQRAWIVWSDASCAYERAQWGEGSGGGPAAAACHLRLTGEQALAFEGQLSMLEGR